jgi:hypothetical protein
VLVAPEGVFSFTTRFQETRFEVEGENWINYKNRGPLAPTFLFLRQEGLGKPFKQARDEAANIQEIVDQALPGTNIKVQPVVVFTSGKAIVEVHDPAIPVVYADPKRKPSLRALLRDVKSKGLGDVVEEPEPVVVAVAKKKKGKPSKHVKQHDIREVRAKEEVLSPEQIETLDKALMGTLSKNVITKQIEEDEA